MKKITIQSVKLNLSAKNTLDVLTYFKDDREDSVSSNALRKFTEKLSSSLDRVKGYETGRVQNAEKRNRPRYNIMAITSIPSIKQVVKEVKEIAMKLNKSKLPLQIKLDVIRFNPEISKDEKITVDLTK